MSVQKTVNTKLAFGLPGEFYDDTPRRNRTYKLANNAAAVPTVGYAFTATANEGEAQPGGTGAFAGILVNPKEQVLRGGLTPSLALTQGAIGTLCSFGHVIVVVAAAVTETSLPVYNTSTGAISGVAADATSAGSGYAFIPNAKFVFHSAAAGGLAVLELNGFANAPAKAGA